jgi:hypothetical protein
MASQGALQVYGTEKLARLGRDLRVIGGPTARGLRSNMRKAIVAETTPMRREVQAAYRATPVKADGKSTGLRNALAKATKVKIVNSSRTTMVRLNVAHPLAAVWEGTKKWRHPVYPDPSKSRDEWTWREQASHPTFFPTVRRRAAAVRVGVVAAIKRTTAQLPKEL